VVCEHLLLSLDAMFTTVDGTPKPLFYTAKLTPIPIGVTFASFGTFISPPMAEVWATGDVLAIAGVLLMTVGCLRMTCTETAARLCAQSDQAAPLVLLGAATALISKDQDDTLRAADKS